MRKVEDTDTEADSHLEGKLASFQEHLDRCRRQFDATVAAGGNDAAMRSQEAQNIAQYSYVIMVLQGIQGDNSESKWRDALVEWSFEAVSLMREGDVPRWKSLATATILEVVSECVRSET